MEERDFYHLHDALPADPFLPADGPPWWIWVLIALAAIALVALLLSLAGRRRRLPAIDVAAARRRAIDAIDAIDPGATATEVATGISLVLRRFLAETLGDPSLFETHEEFLARSASLDGLPERQQPPTRDHFATLARLKYGPDTETDTQALLSDSRALLEQLTPAPNQATHQPTIDTTHPIANNQ